MKSYVLYSHQVTLRLFLQLYWNSALLHKQKVVIIQLFCNKDFISHLLPDACAAYCLCTTATSQVRANSVVSLCLAMLTPGSFCQCPEGLLTPKKMDSAHTVCGCPQENNRASCTLYCRPPSDPKGWDRWLLPAYMLFTLICQQNKEVTSTLYYIGKSLNYELLLFFQKVSSHHCEKDILCGGQAMPLISKAVASHKINGFWLICWFLLLLHLGKNGSKVTDAN